MKENIPTYQADGLTMRSRLFFEPSRGQRGAVLVFPEAFGLDDHALARAKQLASFAYVALACDLHGVGRVVVDLQQAMAELQPLFDDRTRTRARASNSVLVFAARPEVDAGQVAMIGFCFPMSLELARSGANIRAAIEIHTSLATKAVKLALGEIRARVLVGIGADGPFIPSSHWVSFESEMRDAGADWEMQVYGRAVYSFTNPKVGKRIMPDAIRYSAESTARAWASALALLAQTIGHANVAQPATH